MPDWMFTATTHHITIQVECYHLIWRLPCSWVIHFQPGLYDLHSTRLNEKTVVRSMDNVLEDEKNQSGSWESHSIKLPETEKCKQTHGHHMHSTMLKGVSSIRSQQLSMPANKTSCTWVYSTMANHTVVRSMWLLFNCSLPKTWSTLFGQPNQLQ